MQFTDLVHSIRHLDTSLRKGVSSVANCALTVRDWVIGAWILEFEQDGADRAAYGERLVPDLAENLALPGPGTSSLWACRQFFVQYPGILQMLSGESLARTPQFLPILQSHSYYRKHEMSEADRPPVGLLLCTDKDHALAEYALGGMDERLFISTYRLELLGKSQLEAFLRAEAKRLGF